MKRNKKNNLRFENLEQRQMMAGDVVASVSHGTLTVSGDGQGNGVLISEISAGKYSVVGLNHAGGQTRVNGADEIVISHVTRDISVRLEGGNDLFRMNNSRTTDQIIYPEVGFITDLSDVPRDLIVDTGGGNDRIELTGVRVKDDAFISADSGSDVVKLRNVDIQDNLDIGTDSNIRDGGDYVEFRDALVRGTANVETGAGQDRVKFYSKNIFKESLNVETGSSNDSINAYDNSVWYNHLRVAEDVTFNTGSGNDTVSLVNLEADRNVTIQTGTGRDNVTVNETTVGFDRDVYGQDELLTGTLTIDTGSDRDYVLVQNTHVANDLLLDLGNGENVAALYGTTAGMTYEWALVEQPANIEIRSAGDRDSVTVDNCHATDTLMAELGYGNDELLVQFSSAQEGIFDLGLGWDMYQLWQNDFEDQTISNPFGRQIVLPVWP